MRERPLVLRSGRTLDHSLPERGGQGREELLIVGLMLCLKERWAELDLRSVWVCL